MPTSGRETPTVSSRHATGTSAADGQSYLLVGGLCGLTWAAGLRGWMAQLVWGESSYSWLTVVLVLLPGLVVGLLLGWAAYARSLGLRPSRWLVFSPALFARTRASGRLVVRFSRRSVRSRLGVRAAQPHGRGRRGRVRGRVGQHLGVHPAARPAHRRSARLGGVPASHGRPSPVALAHALAVAVRGHSSPKAVKIRR